MTGKQFLKSIMTSTLSLALILAVSAGTVPAQAASLDDMQKQQTTLKAQEKQISVELDKLKNDKADQQAYKEKLDAQIANIEQQIDNLNNQIADLDNDIRTKEAQISGKQKEINTNFEKLKERVYALYLTGEASNLEIVLNAKNIMDLADKAEILRVVSEHDTGLINTLKSDMESVKTQRDQIQANRSAVTAKKTELDQNQSDLAKLEDETSRVIVKLGQNEQQAKQKQTKNAAEQKETEQAIDDWFAYYYASLKSQSSVTSSGSGSTSNNGTEANGSTSNGDGTANGGGTSNNGGSSAGGGYSNSGGFQFPVPSFIRISQPFGSYDMGSFHKGIDIAANYGSTIVAAASGKVVMAGFGIRGSGYGGYGNVVAIDHGNGIMTLYAHMSSMAVSVGQTVTKGQKIGAVGSTGNSTGNHCHLEVRENGTAVNPMNYVG